MTISINNETIEELKELMEEDFPMLINTYITDSDKRLVDLNLAISEENTNEVRESAHGFKGSSANLGVEKLAEISYKLETMGRTGDLSGAEKVFQDLAAEYKIVSAHFKSLL